MIKSLNICGFYLVSSDENNIFSLFLMKREGDTFYLLVSNTTVKLKERENKFLNGYSQKLIHK